MECSLEAEKKMNSATSQQVICAVHVEVATFIHERPLTPVF